MLSLLWVPLDGGSRIQACHPDRSAHTWGSACRYLQTPTITDVSQLRQANLSFSTQRTLQHGVVVEHDRVLLGLSACITPIRRTSSIVWLGSIT